MNHFTSAASLTGQATVWRAIAFLVLWLVLVGGVGSLWLGEAFPAYPAAYAKQLMAIELAALALISLLLRLFPWHTYLPFPAKTLINPPALETLWSVLWPILVGGTITMLIGRWEPRFASMPSAVAAVVDRARRAASVLVGGAIEVDAALRRWPVAGLALAALAVIFGIAMLMGH